MPIRIWAHNNAFLCILLYTICMTTSPHFSNAAFVLHQHAFFDHTASLHSAAFKICAAFHGIYVCCIPHAYTYTHTCAYLCIYRAFSNCVSTLHFGVLHKKCIQAHFRLVAFYICCILRSCFILVHSYYINGAPHSHAYGNVRIQPTNSAFAVHSVRMHTGVECNLDTARCQHV